MYISNYCINTFLYPARCHTKEANVALAEFFGNALCHGHMAKICTDMGLWKRI